MKSLILKTTTLALGAALVLSTAGAGTAEAHGHRGHHFRHHGHHHHHFHRHFYRPYYYNYQYSNCFWKYGKYVCFKKW